MTGKTTKVTFKDLSDRYDEFTASVRCVCTAATVIAGGQPGTEDGIRAFVEHHLHLTGQAADDAVKRILKEEIGEKPVPAETGELDERLTYGVNVIRRNEQGPFLGSWMIHACLKQAASRLRIFIDFKAGGAKGNWSEAAQVRSVGQSLRTDRIDHVYLTDASGQPIKTEWQEFKGRVQSPQGSKSIVHHTECAPVGSRFEFEFRFLRGDLKNEDIQDVLALMMIVGLGSVKSLGCGKFRIEEAEISEESRSIIRKKEKVDPKLSKAGEKAAESLTTETGRLAAD